MNDTYPSKMTIYLALTRQAMLFGVSVEYFFFSVCASLVLVILFDSLSVLLIGLVIYGVGRVIFYVDPCLFAIAMRSMRSRGSRLYSLLGGTYYEPY